MTYLANEDVRDDIFEAINCIFGFSIREFSQIELGYMNLKWKVSTDIGDLFVKQYNKTRYPNQTIQGVETSLIHQSTLHKKGIPCPKIYSSNGESILQSSKGEHFVVMELCEGRNILAGTANEDQMYSLGKNTGEMHKILNANNTCQTQLHWDVWPKEKMMGNWNERWNEATTLACNETLSNLEVQRKILERTDSAIFSDCEKGWSHWDLFVDNILFNSNSVSAILDFDRMNFVYPEFDISRAILSCCIHNGQIHIDKVSAFVEGYREYHKLTNQKLIRSIKLTWWKEAAWVRAAKVQNSTALKRFIEENIWIGNNWGELENIFSTIR